MKYLEVQSKVIFKNPNFQSFSWTGESWEVQLEHRSKIPTFWSLYGLGKTWKYSLRPRFKSPNLNLYVNWERLCPNLSFTVENKMGSFDKAGCISNLLINEILYFLKFQELLINWKKYVSFGKNGIWIHWKFCAYHRIFDLGKIFTKFDCDSSHDGYWQIKNRQTDAIHFVQELCNKGTSNLPVTRR